MNFDQRPRTCAGCRHWNADSPNSPNGYVEAQCLQPADDRDHAMKRASDYCSKWDVRYAA